MNRVLLNRFVTALTLATGLATLGADPIDTWHIRSAPASAAGLDLEGIAYGNGRWVAVGEDGIILSSPDGETWTPEVNPAPADLDDVIFANGTFVALGGKLNNLLTSPDGQNWTKQTPEMSGAYEIIHDGTRFLSILAGGFIKVSTNGVTWSALPGVRVNYDIGGFAFGNGIYVEAGYKRTGQPPDLFSSTDLLEWTQRDSKATQNLMNVGYGLGLFVAVGQGGAITTSADGVEWTPRTSAHTGFIWDVTCNGQYFVAAAQWGRVLLSTDGINWRVHNTDLPWHLKDVAYGNGTFAAVGWDAQIVQSDPLGPVTSTEIRLTNPGKTTPFGFQFNSTSGTSYIVESSADLKTWTAGTNLTANASSTAINDLTSVRPMLFYRVVKP